MPKNASTGVCSNSGEHTEPIPTPAEDSRPTSHWCRPRALTRRYPTSNSGAKKYFEKSARQMDQIDFSTPYVSRGITIPRTWRLWLQAHTKTQTQTHI